MIYNKATSQPIIPWRSDKGNKPTKGIHNGSLLIEVDTATTYIFDAENKVWYPFGGKGSGGGGGSSVTVESLTVTQNGTTTAPSGTAYSPVTVNVPNPSSGSITITENGTYDVTDKVSAIVDIPPSGGAGDSQMYTLSGVDTFASPWPAGLTEANIVRKLPAGEMAIYVKLKQYSQPFEIDEGSGEIVITGNDTTNLCHEAFGYIMISSDGGVTYTIMGDNENAYWDHSQSSLALRSWSIYDYEAGVGVNYHDGESIYHDDEHGAYSGSIRITWDITAFELLD